MIFPCGKCLLKKKNLFYEVYKINIKISMWLNAPEYGTENSLIYRDNLYNFNIYRDYTSKHLII